ncbi:MAG: hypothetical protein JSV51_00430 [Candidatus Bathyarchaeota archaeon]|nr:MAG: hypothetical protein JSV51_00430 [Candidatus Bathyarchaeota archaeon]
MPNLLSNKPQLTGIVILFTGVALLGFTFINAFMLLQEPFSILATGDLARVFGEALAPLIQACIRLMYLGIMGWIGSLLTVRGIPLVTHRYALVSVPVSVAQTKSKPQPVKQEPTPKSTLSKPTSPKPITEPKQEEPKAILITPENQREG